MWTSDSERIYIERLRPLRDRVHEELLVHFLSFPVSRNIFVTAGGATATAAAELAAAAAAAAATSGATP